MNIEGERSFYRLVKDVIVYLILNKYLSPPDIASQIVLK